MNYKSKSVLVIENGLFCEWAVTLSKYFGKVYYYMPPFDGYPRGDALRVGQGIPNVTRLRDFWPLIDEIDLFFFPDIYFGGLQEHLAKLGKRVWGCRRGEELELDRIGAKEHFKRIGIDVGPYRVVKGLDALRDYLQKHDNQYVKISTTRGDMETFKSKNYSLIEPRLDELEHKLGARKKVMEFIVEDEIADAVEIGYDGYTIDGKFPKRVMWGIEVKDKGFVMQADRPYARLPEAIRSVNEMISPTLRAYQYRGFMTPSEIRLTRDGTAYAIDPCCRCGSPPNELYQTIVDNWPDIIWHGAEGEVVEPEFNAKWGAELLLLSAWGDSNWQAVQFPKSIREHVKLRNLTIIDGKYYTVPLHTGIPEIGAVVATGDTMQDAIETCKELAEKVEGHYIEVVPSSLDEAQGEFEKLEEFGVKV